DRVADDLRSRLASAEAAPATPAAEVAHLRDRLGELYVVYAFVSSINGFFPEASRYCAYAFEHLAPDQRYLRAMVRQVQVTVGQQDNHYATYREFLRLTETQSFARSHKMQASALSNLASLQRGHGLLNEALQTVERALALYPDRPAIPMYVMAYIARGMAYYERDELREASADLSRGLQISEYLKMPGMAAEAWAHRGFIEQIHGETDAAGLCFDEASALDSAFFRWSCRTVPQMRLLDRRHFIPAEALAEVRRQAQELLTLPSGPLMSLRDCALLHCATVSYLYEGIQRRALELASFLLARCFEGYPLQMVATLVLNAVILEQEGFRSSARKALRRALRIAQEQGYVRVFVDWDLMIEAMLRQHLASAEAAELSPDFRHRLQRALAAAHPDASANKGGPGLLLTERELEILSLLHGGLTTRGVADLLDISYETVRTHLANCYAKLDVHGRVQAIKYARDHHLI
ncbi:MAG: LuxR C-terminal-related transcriptional regulator, partial [Coriobacteriales bacterium]|nr:LuxR C-terminal-related transcriptional regulator [Coriobacteriales bacterium]